MASPASRRCTLRSSSRTARVSFASARASSAFAIASEASVSRGSRRASTSPRLTGTHSVTATAVTVPEISDRTSAWRFGSSEPTTATFSTSESSAAIATSTATTGRFDVPACASAPGLPLQPASASIAIIPTATSCTDLITSSFRCCACLRAPH